MQHSNNSPWRLPQYQLQHTVSMMDLHEQPTWNFPRGPPSPTISSVSSNTSRSTTPTNSNNPWSSVMASPVSSGASPRGSPESRTPQNPSRSATPVAPKPVRPIATNGGFAPISPPPSVSGESYRGPDYPGSPIHFPGSPTPNPYRNTLVTLPPLNNAFVTPSLLTQYGRLYPELLRRQGWERSTAQRAYTWACSNPRTALLLALGDDMTAWPKAGIFGLSDDSMPFSEADLHRIATNPKKIVEMQWRVTAKELPQHGQHVDFTARETVPLHQISSLRPSGSPEKTVDRVQWLFESDERIVIRKRFVIARPSQKTALLNQIQGYRQLEHKSIAKLMCSYCQGSVFGIITPAAQYNLDDYLSLPASDMNRARLLLDWINDLCQAVDFLHARQIAHRGIRPRKILIDGNRIVLAPFGIGTSSDGQTPASPPVPKRLDQLQAYFQDQSYVYAAPEVIIPRAKKAGRPADVFSLGCVFLAMMTAIKSQSLASFAQYRAGNSLDVSFHNNLDRVGAWRIRLQALTGLGVSGVGKREQQAKSEANILGVIETMIQSDPGRRIKMRKLAPYLLRWSEGKASFGGSASTGGRRRSLDGLSGNVPGMNGTIGNGVVNGGNAASSSNTTQAPGLVLGRNTEIATLDGYFSQRRHEEAATNWGVR